jgi:hypothetical protein
LDLVQKLTGRFSFRLDSWLLFWYWILKTSINQLLQQKYCGRAEETIAQLPDLLIMEISTRLVKGLRG